jgi:hypothetical protein
MKLITGIISFVGLRKSLLSLTVEDVSDIVIKASELVVCA